MKNLPYLARCRNSPLLAVVVLVASSLLPAIAHAEEPAVVIDYVVQEGDNCTRLAKRFWGSRNKYSILHEYNPGMGPTPHQLHAGDVLRIPFFADATGPEAEVTARHREVRAREANKKDWSLADLGLDLYRGWRVNTLERSMAELTFRDTSKVYLRQNTLVIIYGATGVQARKATTTARLEKGTLRSRLGELAGLQVDTPTAEASLGEGRALVAVDDGGTSRVSNHGGKPLAVRSTGKSRKKVAVKRGFGSKVQKGGAPGKPKPLPPTPSWSGGQPVRFVGIDGFSGTLRGKWGTVDKAVAYYVEIARGADGSDVIAALRVPSQVTEFEAHGLPPGRYYAFVASVDDDEFESIPSSTHQVELLGVDLDGPAGTKPLWPSGAADLDESTARIPRVLPGAVVRSPSGLSCAVGQGKPGDEVTLRTPGVQRMDCVDESGSAVPGFDVEVVDVRVTAARAGADTVTLERDRATKVEVAVESDIELPLLAPRPKDGLRVKSVELAGRNRWEVVLVAEASLADSGVLDFGLEADPKGPVLAQMPYVVDEVGAQDSATLESVRERHMIEFGVAGGATFFSPQHQLYDDATSERRPFQTASGTIDLRAGYYPVRWVGLEVEGAAMPTATEDRRRGTAYAFGGQVVAQLPYRVTPFVAVGGGLVGISSPSTTLGNDVDGAVQFGGGLKFFATKNIAIRLGVRDTLLPRTGSGVSHNVLVTGGLSVILRRQSPGRLRRKPR